MKRILTLGILLSMLFSASAQMQAMFGYSTFYRASDQTPYVETYLLFDAWTMHFVQQPTGGYRATAEVTLIVRQQDSICHVKKYDLSTPTLATLDSLNFNVLDLQRFSLPNGIYDLDITLRDKGLDAQPLSLTEKLVINYGQQKPVLSSVQLMASVKPTVQQGMLSRGGYDMEPYVDDFLPEQMGELIFYYEVYNIDKEPTAATFVAMAYIEEIETGLRVEDIQQVSRKKAASTVPVLGSLNISELPSGNYNLVVELRNRDGQTLLYRKLPFFRSNPGVKNRHVSDFSTTFVGKYTDEEELNLYLDALYPIASDNELREANLLTRRNDIEAKQAFLYEFWSRRSVLSPETEWLKYKQRIDYVQEHFSYPMTRGIMTDFGRVYLKYGPPDYIRDEKNLAVLGQGQTMIQRGGNITDLGYTTETGSTPNHVFYLPYQLWRYNQLEGDIENRVFLFWDQFRSGFYKLLNSNAKGELQEAGWETRLSRGEVPTGAVGAVGQQFNRGY